MATCPRPSSAQAETNDLISIAGDVRAYPRIGFALEQHRLYRRVERTSGQPGFVFERAVHAIKDTVSEKLSGIVIPDERWGLAYLDALQDLHDEGLDAEFEEQCMIVVAQYFELMEFLRPHGAQEASPEDLLLFDRRNGVVHRWPSMPSLAKVH